MPEIKPASAEQGSLFCLEHRGIPATQVLVFGGLVKISLCDRCFASLIDTASATRYRPTSRNSWSAV